MRILALLLCALLAGCSSKKESSDKSDAPAASMGTEPVVETMASPPPGEAPASPPKPVVGSPADAAGPDAEVRALLTEEKVGKFVIYQKAMSGAGKLAREVVTMAAGKREEAVKDVIGGATGQGMVATMQKALADSGLTQQEAMALTRTLSKHLALRMILVGARKALAKASGPLKDVYQKQVNEGEAELKAFGEKYGATALAAVDKHEAALLEAQSAMLKAFMGGGARRRRP